jgi:tape measure domain-containing protein
MDIAKLSIVIEGQEAEKSAAAVSKNIDRIGASADSTGGKLKSFRADLNLLRFALAGLGIERAIDAIVQADLQMERIRRTLTAVSGSSMLAAKELDFLRREADRVGVGFKDSAGSYARFTAAAKETAIAGETARKTFVTVSEASRVLGLSGAQTASMFLALEQMISKGVVQSQELRLQLGNALPGALQISARAMGVTTSELNELVRSGRLLTEDFLPKFERQLSKEFGIGGAVASTSAELARLSNAWLQFKATVGDGLSPVTRGVSKTLTGILQAVAPGKSRAELVAQANADKEAAIKATEFIDPTLSPAARAAAQRDESIGGQLAGVFSAPLSDFIAVREQERRLMEARQSRQKQRDEMHAALENPALPPGWDETLKEFGELRTRIHLETLTGIEREKQAVTDRYNKQLELVNLLDGKIHSSALLSLRSDLEKSKTVQLQAIDVRELGRLKEEQARKDAAFADEQSDAYLQLGNVMNRIYELGAGDAYQAQVHRLTEEFRGLYTQLIALAHVADVPEELFQKIKDAEKTAIGRIPQPKNTQTDYMRWAGIPFDTLTEQRSLNRQTMLTTQDEELYKKSSHFHQGQTFEMNRRIDSDMVGNIDAITFGFNSAVEEWGSSARKMADIGKVAAESLSDNFTEAFSSVILGTKSVEEGFSQMAQAIMEDMLRIMIRKIIVESIVGSFSALSGGFGGSVSSIATAMSGTGGLTWDANATGMPSMHSGGVVGYDTGSMFTASRSAWIGAPKFHGGGVVGGDVPIIAKSGETVFTAEQLNALGKVIASNQSKSEPTVVANFTDPRALEEFLATNPGAVLNIIGRHKAQVRRMLM